MKAIDNQRLAAQLVRSWRDNFVKEGGEIPPILLVGGKALFAADVFTNIAAAIDRIPKSKTTRTK